MNLSATPFDADYYLPYYLLFVGVFVGLGGGMLDPFGVCSTILGFLLNELFLLFIFIIMYCVKILLRFFCYASINIRWNPIYEFIQLGISLGCLFLKRTQFPLNFIL